MRKLYSVFLLILFSIVIISCSDSIVESVPSIDENNEIVNISPTFSEIQSDIFNQSCAFSGCHVNGSVNPDLSGNSYNNVVNRVSSTGMNYISPNDPENSYLLLKIQGSNSISGSRMPRNASPIQQNKIDAVIQWINDGAPNN